MTKKKRKLRDPGRPKGMSDATIEKCERVEFYYDKGELSLNKCIEKANVSKYSYYKWRDIQEEKKLEEKLLKRK